MQTRVSARDSEYSWYATAGVLSNKATINNTQGGLPLRGRAYAGGGLVSFTFSIPHTGPIASNANNNAADWGGFGGMKLFDWWGTTGQVGFQGGLILLGATVVWGPALGLPLNLPGGTSTTTRFIIEASESTYEHRNTFADEVVDLTAQSTSYDFVLPMGATNGWSRGALGQYAKFNYLSGGLTPTSVFFTMRNIDNNPAHTVTDGSLQLSIWGVEY